MVCKEAMRMEEREGGEVGQMRDRRYVGWQGGAVCSGSERPRGGGPALTGA